MWSAWQTLVHTPSKEEPTQEPHPRNLLHVKSIDGREHALSCAVTRRCRRCQSRCLPGVAC